MRTPQYETHVTVPCATSGEWERLAAWAAGQGVKATRIVLARGRVPSQPMLTVRGGTGLAGHRAGAAELQARLRAAGFRVVRVKTETEPWAPQAPQEDADAAAEGTYFEHHVKLALPGDFDRERLLAAVRPHGAHLSWNARRVTGRGRHERFVTQRCHGVGARTAGGRLAALLAELAGCSASADGGHEVLAVEREFVLYDSDLSVDEGWIEPGAGAGAESGAGAGAGIGRTVR